ncbi:hypothetical protein O3P69_006449 [Scylla paramamosain]|uniref:Uncharacterized protein n=1 Tax=Scylla paramamosain TaxID=85552 RepID=A0AAW0U2G1_SCYPA
MGKHMGIKLTEKENIRHTPWSETKKLTLEECVELLVAIEKSNRTMTFSTVLVSYAIFRTLVQGYSLDELPHCPDFNFAEAFINSLMVINASRISTTTPSNFCCVKVMRFVDIDEDHSYFYRFAAYLLATTRRPTRVVVFHKSQVNKIVLDEEEETDLSYEFYSKPVEKAIVTSNPKKSGVGDDKTKMKEDIKTIIDRMSGSMKVICPINPEDDSASHSLTRRFADSIISAQFNEGYGLKDMGDNDDESRGPISQLSGGKAFEMKLLKLRRTFTSNAQHVFVRRVAGYASARKSLFKLRDDKVFDANMAAEFLESKFVDTRATMNQLFISVKFNSTVTQIIDNNPPTSVLHSGFLPGERVSNKLVGLLVT